MTSSFLVVAVIGAFWTGSLALLADAAHMLTEVGGLFLALVAIRFAARSATPKKTFGYVWLEVLSSLANAVVLLLMTVYIFMRPISASSNHQRFSAGRCWRWRWQWQGLPSTSSR